MKIAILGLGVVGKGVYDIITNDHIDIEVEYVLELDKTKLEGINAIVAKDIFEIVNDDSVDTVVELIGGKTIAKQFVELALINGKNVVTANKALISEYYKELNDLARKNDVHLLFEASVGGAINIIDPLKTIAKMNKIEKIEGIINGSTNFILSKIFNEDMELIDAFDKARELGYIETGSNDDMEGLDLMRKINILSIIAYDQFINEEDIIRLPLADIKKEMIDYLKSRDLTMKYVATSEFLSDKIMIHLEPNILDKKNILANIDYEDNIITLYGKHHKKQSFVGQGAGRYPTASAVLYDLLKIQSKPTEEPKFENHNQIDNEMRKFRFLIQKGDELIKTELLTLNEVLNIKDIEGIARIDEGAYEKI